MLCFVWTCDSRGKCNTSWGSPLNVPIWPPQHMDFSRRKCSLLVLLSQCLQSSACCWGLDLAAGKEMKQKTHARAAAAALWVFRSHFSQGFSPLYWVCREGMSSLWARVARVGTGQHTAVGVDVFFACSELVRSSFVTCWLIVPDFDQGMSHYSGSPPWRSLWF